MNPCMNCSISPCSRVKWSSLTKDSICSKCGNIAPTGWNQSEVHAAGERRVISDLLHNYGQHDNRQPGIFFSVYHIVYKHNAAPLYWLRLFQWIWAPWRRHENRAEVKSGISCDVLGSCRSCRCLVCVRLLHSCQRESKRRRFRSNKKKSWVKDKCWQIPFYLHSLAKRLAASCVMFLLSQSRS